MACRGTAKKNIPEDCLKFATVMVLIEQIAFFLPENGDGKLETAIFVTYIYKHTQRKFSLVMLI
jgi:hypothetical protein